MPEQFDPYHKWLGIRPEEQPANHYRLLGITPFEDDPDAITSAAYQRMAHVRTYQLGKHSDLSQKILNELATAKVCLLNPEKKAAYDEQLRKITKASLSEAIPVEPEVEPDPTTFPVAIPLDRVEVPVADPLANLAELTRSAPISKSQESRQQSLHRLVAPPQASAPAIGPTKRRKKGQISPHGSIFRVIGLAVAGVLGLGTAWVLNSYFHGGDKGKKETAQAEHSQSARKSEAVTVVDQRAQSAASKSPGRKKPPGQIGLPMLGRSSDPSSSTVSTKPVIEAKPSVDTPLTAEKPPIEKTLSQEEEELKAASEAAKSTEDHQAVAEKGLALADRAIVEGNADLAKTAVKKSLVAARKADDVALTKRATQLLMQLQNPLSESLKEEARKRRGLKKRLVRAAEESLPEADSTAAGIAPPPAVAPFDETTAKQHQARWAKYLGVSVVQTNSIGMKLVLIPPGEFIMGSPKALIEEELRLHGSDGWYRDHLPGEGPQHRVRITKPYWLGATDVTQEEYQHVRGSNPSHFQGDPKRPVEQVSWDDAVEFCRRLSKLPGERAAKRRYGLPTEAQWEHACRAGTTTRWYSGDDEAGLAAVAWFKTNAGGQTHSVGSKKPNAWGLYDMHGNVWQWCQDWYDKDYYAKLATDDPAGPPGGSDRVSRGGSWCHPAGGCRSAHRGHDGPGRRIHDMGFRVSLVLADK